MSKSNMFTVGMLQRPENKSVDFYRGFGVLHHIEAIDRLYEIPYTGADWNKYLQVIDVLYLDRRFISGAANVIKTCKENGIKVWIDIDDDLFNFSPYHDRAHLYSNPSFQKKFKDDIAAADIVTVTTETLRKLYYPVNENIHVIPNAWNDFAFPQMALISEKTRAKPRIAWRGGSSHRRDLFTVHKAINSHIEKANWTFYGFMPECIDPAVQFYPFMDAAMFFNTFQQNKSDYALVALENNLFNAGKSNIAWIEATVLAGAACIAPAMLPEWQMPGIIAYSGEKGLNVVLDGVCLGKIDRVDAVMQSQQYIRENLRLSRVNDLRVEVLSW